MVTIFGFFLDGVTIGFELEIHKGGGLWKEGDSPFSLLNEVFMWPWFQLYENFSISNKNLENTSVAE